MGQPAKPLKQPVKPLKAKPLKQPAKPLKQPVKPLKQPAKPLKAKPLKQPAKPLEAKPLKQPVKPLKAKPLKAKPLKNTNDIHNISGNTVQTSAADTEGLGTTAIVLIGIGGLVVVFTVVMVLKRKKSKDK